MVICPITGDNLDSLVKVVSVRCPPWSLPTGKDEYCGCDQESAWKGPAGPLPCLLPLASEPPVSVESPSIPEEGCRHGLQRVPPFC